MNRLLIALFSAFAGVLFWSPQVHALGLQVTPLQYKTELMAGEKKRGVVDVSNPSSQSVRVKTSVQAFRQIDDNGTLQFYNSEQLSAGIRLDLDEFELGPREAVRMYFELDGTKLPSGDVYGAIFFTLDPLQPKAGVGQTVRVGTVLSIVNGTPGSRTAEVSKLDAAWLQLDDTVTGIYTIKNTARTGSATGFYPTVSVKTWPFGKTKKSTGKLVFAGRSRDNTFSAHTPPFGLYKISVYYGDSVRSRWVMVASPVSLLVLVFVVLVLGVIVRSVRRRRRAVSANLLSE